MRSTYRSVRRGDYPVGHHAAVLASHGVRTAGNSCGYLLPHLREGMSVLDVGCGPGTITLDLAEVVAPGAVTGIENVEDPLVAARREAQERGDITTVFERGDVFALAYDDDSFDVVHAHQVLQHLTDPVSALMEMSRVCTPGGFVAARDVDYEVMTWHPASTALTLWLSTYRSTAQLNNHQPDAGRHLREWANAAALQDVMITASSWCYADTESTKWWSESQADRVLTPAFAARARSQGLSDSDLLDMARGWRTWGTHPDAFFVMLHGELLAKPATH
ncbi:MAG TPA: class I SAM-dependent methyltransferase [Dermatophilaceae bacterium]|nr:class I SAM-dependent methyltransferase [Dermatophilaceae bacterium]